MFRDVTVPLLSNRLPRVFLFVPCVFQVHSSDPQATAFGRTLNCVHETEEERKEKEAGFFRSMRKRKWAYVLLSRRCASALFMRRRNHYD